MADDTTKQEQAPVQFEAALAELEQLVEAMEGDELSLEEALKHFERGVRLTKTCQKALGDAEQKVRMLVEQEGGETLEAFADARDADGDT